MSEKPTEAEIEFNKALIKAQAELKPAKKDSENPAFRSKYADYEAVAEACRHPLNSNGIGWLHRTVPPREPGCVSVETVLIHVGGHRESCVCDIPFSKRDAHGYGSALSYGERYGLKALTGLATGDDDGNGAAGAAPSAKAQVGALKASLRSAKVATAKATPAVVGGLEWPPEYAGKTLAQLTSKQLDWCITNATKRAEEGGDEREMWADRLISFTDEVARRMAGAVTP